MTRTERKSFVVYTDWRDKLTALSDDEFGKLFRGIFDYVESGKPPDSTPMVNLAFGFIRGALDADKAKYDARCIRNAGNASKRWQRGGRDESNSGRSDATDIPRDATGIPNDATDIPQVYQTPVITDNCKLITDNCVSTDVDTSFCAASKADAAPKQEEKASDDAVCTLPLNDGSGYVVTQDQIDRWAALYPRVDIMQGLRNMLAWLEANPQNRKTRRGIKRFINGWLAKDQDRGRNQRTDAGSDQTQSGLADWEKQWLEDLNRTSQNGGKL